MYTRRKRSWNFRYRAQVLAEALERRTHLSFWPQGPAMPVTSPADQGGGGVAIDATGNMVVTWGESNEIFMRRFNATGTPLSVPTQVNTFTTDLQFNPRIAAASNGTFVITWSSMSLDGSSGGVAARLYNAAGAPLTGEFVVNTYTTGAQTDPAVAMNDSGNFIIAWPSQGQDGSVSGVYAKRFDSGGAAVGGEFHVNTYTTGDQGHPSVAMDSTGNFAVTWQDPRGVLRQRYTSAGAATGSEFLINSGGRNSSISMDSVGNSVIAWETGTLGVEEIRALRFDSGGNAIGSVMAVNSYTTNSQVSPSVDLGADGSFAVAWTSYAQDGDNWGVFAAAFDGSNARTLADLQIHTHTTFQQRAPSIAINNDGEAVISWTDHDVTPFNGYYFRQYLIPQAGTSAAIGNRVWRDSDGDGVQDLSENGLPGIKVELVQPGGTIVGEDITDSNGEYGFLLPPGESAHLKFMVPAGYSLTPANAGSDDGADSDADIFTGQTPTFIAGAAGTVDNTIDAGMLLYSQISGVAFLDRNNNGLREAIEELLVDVPIFADYDSDGLNDANEPVVLSSPGGVFSLPGVLAGNYPLGVGDPSLWTGPDSPTTHAVPPEAVITGLSLPVRTPVRDAASFADPEEHAVNTHTTNNQSIPAIAMDDDGTYVVVWSSSGQDGNDGGVFARRFAADGTPQGTEFQVNQYTSGRQSDPEIAMYGDGSFLIAWEGNGAEDSSGIYARRFGENGDPLTNQFLVNSYTTGAQSDPVLIVDESGVATVVWGGGGTADSAGIYARRFDTSLSPLATEFLNNATTTGTQFAPFIAAAGNTGFLVTWGDPSGLLARRFNPGAAPVSGEMLVSFNAASFLRDVVGDDDGNYLIAWPDLGGGSKVVARRYSAAFETLGQPFQINSGTGIHTEPQLVMNDAGEFVVIWSTIQGPGNVEILARHYNAAGIPQGPSFQVNVYTAGSQGAPVAAMDAEGNFVVTWFGPRDGDIDGIASRRYTVAPPAPVASADFIWQGNTQHIAVSFDQPEPELIASMTPQNVQLRNLTTGQIIAPTAIIIPAPASESSPDSAMFTFPTLPNGMLPNGRYMVTIYPGNAPEAYAHSFEVFFVNGDANHDGKVDARDLYLMSQNWMTPSNFEYARGDFNLDGTVDRIDLTILAQNWQADLPALAPPPSAPTPTSAGRPGVRTPSRNSNSASELLDSTVQRASTRTPARSN